MRALHIGMGASLLLWLASTSQTWPQENFLPYITPIQYLPEKLDLVQTQGKDKKEVPVEPKVDPEPPDFDLFAQTAAASRTAPQGRNPRMIGDFPGSFATQTYFVPTTQTITTFQNVTTYQTVTQTTLTTVLVEVPDPMNEGTVLVPQSVPVTSTSVVPVTTRVPVTTQVTTLAQTVIVIPQAIRGPFKIGENESAHPENRVYLTYNYFNGIRGPSGAPYSTTSVQETTVNGEAVTITTPIPGVASPRFDLHRQVLGFERLVLDGRSSIGLRVPLSQMQGDGSFSASGIGDMSVIFKRALFGELTGNLISGGLVVTVPTGPEIETVEGNFHECLIQPFVGGRYGLDRLVTQGFLSVAVPTDSRDVTVLFGDLSCGYNLYSAPTTSFLSSITPVVEAHLTTPLTNLNGTGPITIPTMLTITAGVHLGIFERSTLTLAANTPVTGPRLFNIEAMAFLNYNY